MLTTTLKLPSLPPESWQQRFLSSPANLNGSSRTRSLSAPSMSQHITKQLAFPCRETTSGSWHHHISPLTPISTSWLCSKKTRLVVDPESGITQSNSKELLVSTSAAEDKPRPKKRCLNCAEDIWQESQYCKSCGTYQNWRRFVPFSQTMLAVITSCLAVLTVLVPVISKATSRDRAEMLMVIDEVNHFNHPNAGPRLTCSIAMLNTGKAARIMDQEVQWKIVWADGSTETGETVFSHPLKERIIPVNETCVVNAELFSEKFSTHELYKMQLQPNWVHAAEMEEKHSTATLELTARYKWSPRVADQAIAVGSLKCFAYKRKAP